jgi:hypothetical protein
MKNLLTALTLALLSATSFGQTSSVTNTTLTILSTKDTVKAITTTTTTITSKVVYDTAISKTTVYDTLKYKPPVTTYTASGTITLQSNKTYAYLSINGAAAGIQGNGVSNVHITNLRITNISGFAISLWNCQNIVIDNCYISSVGFGVYAQGGCKQIKVNNNQFLNINGINSSSPGHAVQFNGVNGGGNQINYNRIENVAGVALHPHDMINLFQCNGLQGDSVQVISNIIRGGQLTLWPTQYSGAAGIIMGDVSGSYQVCRNNILVNPGYSGIQCNGNSFAIKIDHNQVYSSGSPITANAITVLNPNRIEVSYNKTNWTNHNGYNVLLADGETQYYLGNPASPMPLNMSTNYWKAPISASILPATIVTMK